MGFLSIFKRKAADAPSPGTSATPVTAPARRSSAGNNTSNNSSEAPADEVMRARVRARQRLIGAAVLVVIGIVGFPLVFETQPRPIPVDIPIEIPKKDGAPPLVMPPPRGATSRETPASAASPASVAAAPADDVITESRNEAGKSVAPAASDVKVAKAAEPKAAEPKAAETQPAEAKPAEAKPPEAKPAETKVAATAHADSARAKALLEAKSASPAKAEPSASASGRFVVQVGAFADAAAARETRQKAEKLGLKTYTQVAATSSGSRIRVRLGPFASRDEADKALAKAKGAGLSAVVLTL